jgi:MFS family permease
MKSLAVITRRPIAVLWGGLVFSAIGDELYSVALIWFATGLLGSQAGYVPALQAATILLFSLAGGLWTDRYDPRRVMIAADVMRSLAMLVIPLLSLVAPVSIWSLLPVVILVSSLKPAFDPALQASLPRLAADRQLLQATNGLFDATRRLARIIGPGLVGVLHTIVPVVHFFTVNALTFAVSALAVGSLRRELPPLPAAADAPRKAGDALRGLGAGFVALRGRTFMQFHLLAFGVTSAAWYLGLILATAIRIRQQQPDNVGSYALVIMAYGVGNLVSNLVVAGARFANWDRVMALGRLVSGIGFYGMALAADLPQLMAAACIAAMGAPMTQIPFAVLLQTGFALDDVVRVYRVRMVSEWGCMFVALLASPLLLDHVGAAGVVFLCSALYLATGAMGFLRFAKSPEE